jgi:hypothetical protein
MSGPYWPLARFAQQKRRGGAGGRVENWRLCSVGPAYPFLPVSVGVGIEHGRATLGGGLPFLLIPTMATFPVAPYNAGRRDFPGPV